ncbi:hypothetical protein EC396_13345 [Lutibacter sp. HS1-25]|uniref:PD40 domain-containing protein n=1 Tax=Lutibacter sp. HS1-25 TaxID=2485000 RepID=UPI0010117336|nr:PD40 domain-containing protein [Lutibacter sp. HS1-25]RXP46860.1 hypothetical protein EC396_13345 [Lutibacter sp. HS1-25]
MNRGKIKTTELLFIIFFSNPIILWALTRNLLLSFSVTILSIIFGVIVKKVTKNDNVIFFYINLLFIGFLFVSAELIFNTNFSEYIIKDLYDLKGDYYFNKPFLKEKFEDKEFTVNYITNKQGYRIEEHINPEITIDKCDWLFIGDSYTQGAQVNFDKLYSSRLFEKNPNKIIINSGISGFGLPEEYYYYRNKGKDLGSKKVFLQICNFNDFMKVEKREYDISDYLMQKSNFVRWLLWGFKYENPTELPLGRWTEPFFNSNENNELYNIFYKPSSDNKRKDSLNVLKYIKWFKDETLKNNSELIIILIPTKEQISSKYFDEVIDSFNLSKNSFDMEKPNMMMNKICDSLGIELIDLLIPFKTSQEFPFYSFDEHLNEKGHQLLANEIDKFIKKRDSSKLPSSIGNQFIGNRYPNEYSANKGIIYQSYRDGNMELFIGDSLLENKTRITFNNIDESHPNFSSTLNKLCFTQGDQSEFNTEVIISDLNGFNRECVTSEENIFGAIPWFSSDGSKICYAEYYVDSLGVFSLPQIVIKDIKSKNKEFITSNNYESWRPVFSSDNKYLVYISKRNQGQFDVYLYDLLTKEEINLTNSPYDEWDPNFSFNSDKIVYSAYYSGNWDLFEYNLNSRKTERLTFSLGDEWDPSYSKDGCKIFYAADYLTHNGIYFIDKNQ